MYGEQVVNLLAQRDWKVHVHVEYRESGHSLSVIGMEKDMQGIVPQ